MRSLTRIFLPVRYREKPLVRKDAQFSSAETSGYVAKPAVKLDGHGRMGREAPRRADPAPSRLNYRIQRWMLTPGIRLGLRIGVPLCLALAAGIAFWSDEARRDAFTGFIAELRASIQERPEFMVKLMVIDGAGTNLAQDIREVVPLDFPVSSFDLDVAQIRDVITGLDPVKSASVRVRPGGILQVDVAERQPVVVWRTRQGIEMLDETGAHIDILTSRKLRTDLPLIAGKGADAHVDEALALFAVAEPLGERMRGLVRVGERRWDLVLDRGQRIMLPTTRPIQALERVLAVNEVQDMLERDVASVDMRIGERPTLRMTQNATEDWWRIRNPGGDGQD